MIKLFLIKLIIFTGVTASFAQDKKVEIAYYGGINATYECKGGFFHGKYQSYYSNGQKCAEGAFENNFRIGEWSVWDSEGKLSVKRFYESPFVYTTTFPKTSSSPLIDLLNIPQYRPTRNKDGFVEHHFIHERMVFYERILWRYLPDKDRNSFWMKKAFNYINAIVLKKEIDSYSNDKFEKEISIDSIQIENLNLIGFKIKEVFFFDTDRFLTESRILGICPVVIDKQTKDTIDFYWVYYPEARSFLAKKILKTKTENKNIQNYDDIFFFRYFYSYAYEKENIYGEGEKITSILSKKALEKKSDKIEMENIEFEHRSWVAFSRKE